MCVVLAEEKSYYCFTFELLTGDCKQEVKRLGVKVEHVH